ESPLQFILKNRSLRISYYLVLFMALSYIIFRGKRRQKIIPIVERNENTSLEYVATVSQLFEGQKQHKKLVRHLEDIFYHFTKKRYFLDRDLTDFGERLSRKSRISHEEIADLLFEFDRAKKKLNLGDDHLVILNKHLDSFYKNCK
ncbi:MAG: hypothetical protein KDC53_24540, partial [Saprospiraceae bacterium]|nr:hypothetical protein [Saprospiraceae bacterium]